MKNKKNKAIKSVIPIILAGGLGTRMKSENPKALSYLLENYLIYYPIEALLSAKRYFDTLRGGECQVSINKIGVVTGYKGELIKDYLLGEKRFSENKISFDFTVQEEYLGTGDAALKALDMLNSYDDDTELLFLPCDMPLIKAETFEDLIKFHLASKNNLTVLSFSADNPYSYGRILRDEKGYVIKIVEENELINYQDSVRNINEVNSGVYVVKLGYIRKLIRLIKPDNIKKEYYLTDIVEIFFKNNLRVIPYNSPKKDEFIGVNSRTDLLNAQSLMQKRVIKRLLLNGVNFLSTDNLYIGYNADIRENSTIYPGVFISGNTLICKGATIEVGSVIKNSVILDNSTIKSYSVLDDAFVYEDVQIGPFARIRPSSVLHMGAKVGNFVEIKKSVIGKNTKASHLSYIGDSIVGDNVNIGAGVITCNYDGVKKFNTIIEDGCFIGSDSQLIAPVKIGKDAYIASGTTVTKDVPEGALSISRVPQKVIDGWASKKTKKR